MRANPATQRGRLRVEDIMKREKRRGRGQAGMSLVEATIILMVLVTLTAVIAPSIQDYVTDAKFTKAKEDVEGIGVAIASLLNDTGNPFLLVDGAASLGSRFVESNRVDLAVSPGVTPAVASGVTTSESSGNVFSTVAWTSAIGTNPIVESLNDHLVENDPNYTKPSTAVGSADPDPPTSMGQFGFGWRGAYLSPIIGPDPWGYRYAVNSVYLGAATDSSASGEGKAGTGWSADTFVLSPGPNAQIEVNFTSTNFGTAFGSTVANDDIVFVISGYGR